MSSLNPRPDVMGTEPSGRSVEDRGTDPAGTLVLAVVDLLQRVEDLLVAAVLLRVLDDVVLARGVVHPGEGLLDVDGTHHADGLPRPPPGDARIRSGSGRRHPRRAPGRPGPAEGGGCAGARRREPGGGGGRLGAAAQGRRPGCAAALARRARRPRPERTAAARGGL